MVRERPLTSRADGSGVTVCCVLCGAEFETSEPVAERLEEVIEHFEREHGLGG